MKNITRRLLPVAATCLSTAPVVAQTLESATFVKEEASATSRRADVDRPGDGIEEITVTGSRIGRGSFEMPTPVQIIGPEVIVRSGLNNIGDILVRSPVMGVGQGTSNAQQNPDGGSVFVDLRGMGIERTLTLVNGRRRVSGSSLSSAVDLSTIPAAMIDSVEIITGGASAVYGADAVTGVVNIKLKTGFDGLEISGRTGASEHGDAGSYALSIAGGTEFSEDRGAIALGLTYSHDEPLMFKDRDFARINRIYVANPANTGPNDGIYDNLALENWRLLPSHPAGTFFILGRRHTIDPTLRPTQNDNRIDFSWAEGGDGFDGGLWDQLRAENTTVSGLLTLRYEITESSNFFSDVQFAHTETESPGQPTFNYDMVIQRDNPFIPADLAAAMDAAGRSSLGVIRTHYDHGAVTDNLDRNTYTIVTGFNGELGSDFHWEAFYQYGEYRNERRQRNTRINSRFFEAIDVVRDPLTGEPICRSATARSAGCLPLNVLGRDLATPEALAYFQHTRLSDVRNTQQIAGVGFTGDAFQLPAGPLSFAIGAEYREETLSARDDGLAVSGQLDRIFSTGFQPVDADFSVKEAYAEVRAPILSDKPGLQSVILEGAARFSDYTTIGQTTAWKGGLEWAPMDDIRIRATRSRSVRAPNLNELLSPGSFVMGGPTDPCDATRIDDSPNRLSNCRALGIPEGWLDPSGTFTRLLRLGGNPELNEETSDSWTVGVVLRPSFAPGLNISIDYWKITIDGAINPIPTQDIVDKCVDSASLENPFCPLVLRGDDLAIDVIDSRDINIGELKADGIDFQVSFPFNLTNRVLPGDFIFGLTGTYLRRNEQLVDASDPASLIVYDGNYRQPHWRASMALGYNLGAFALNWTARYVGPSVAEADVPREKFENSMISSRLYNDLYASYALGRRVDISLGVNNVLNVEPPTNPYTYAGGGGSGTSSKAAFYDSLGRYFFVGTRMKF